MRTRLTSHDFGSQNARIDSDHNDMHRQFQAYRKPYEPRSPKRWLKIILYIPILACQHICIPIPMHPNWHTYTHTQIHIHTYTHTHIHIYTYTYTYTHIHTYTYTHIHTYWQAHCALKPKQVPPLPSDLSI